jgi:spore coat polysaccharide biosynthesis protein SpsF
MTNVVTVVQARMESSRLPGKVLLPLGGQPLLLTMLQRLRRSHKAGTIVVATTTSSSDDTIAKLCAKNDFQIFRGNPTDLIDRHYQCALEFNAEAVLKIPSDCPLIDPAVVDRVVTAFNTTNYDYVSNLHPASYPDGQDVEVMRMEVLARAWREAESDFEREHTTPYIWERPDDFHIGNVVWESGRDCSMSHRLTIDYEEDYEAIKTIYNELFPLNPHFNIDDIIRMLDNRPDLMAINARYAGVNWYRHHVNTLKTISLNQTRLI